MPKTNFDAAIPVILDHEGYFADDKHDPGGATKYGISLQTLRRLGYDVNADGEIDVADSRALTKAAAIEIYRREYWDVLNLDSVLHQAVATRLFDICVNAGPSAAVEVLRRAIRSCTTENYDDVESKTTLINEANEISEEEMVVALRSEQAGYYRVLVAKNPDKYGRYLNGWLNRAYSSETFVG